VVHKPLPQEEPLPKEEEKGSKYSWQPSGSSSSGQDPRGSGGSSEASEEPPPAGITKLNKRPPPEVKKEIESRAIIMY
jgi:hypothetical protein